MRKFLRFLMLVLMVAWGSQGFAEYVEIKPSSFPGEPNYDTGSVDFNNKDITISTTKGGYWSNRRERKNAYACSDTRLGGPTGSTLVIPVTSEFTITCNVGLIDYVAFSFNNTGVDGNSQFWDNIKVKLYKDGPEIETKDQYYHTHHTSGTLDTYWNKTWWGRYGSGVHSITFYDNRSDWGKRFSNKNTTNLFWLYVFYHKDSTAPTVTINNNGIPTFYDNSGGKVTMSATGSGDNNSGTAIYYTDNNTQATTSGTKYSTTISNFNCSKMFRAISQSNLKVKDLGGDVNDDDFSDLPAN